jgi:hypothetical protein
MPHARRTNDSSTAAFLFCLFLGIALFALPTSAKWTIPSASVGTSARAALRTLVQSNKDSFIPGFVRLAFHDCLSTTCDGCINTNHAMFTIEL